MKILIVEDEKPAALRLQKLLHKIEPQLEVLAILESVELAVSYLQTIPPDLDLIFMDIQLADGLSFEIFKQVEVKLPVIFTTAFNQYTLNAFKVNSIDYLLKPIDPIDLERALNKFRELFKKARPFDYQILLDTLKNQQHKSSYKQRFLIKSGQELKFIPRQDIRYFYSKEGLVFGQLEGQKKYNFDFTLEQLDELLPPDEYFRVNRKMILQIDAIHKIHTYFNGRLKLDILPKPSFEVVVSRDRVPNFKTWLDR